MPRGRLYAQVLIRGVNLHQDYSPQVIAAAPKYAGRLADVDAQTVGIVAQRNHFTLLVVLYCIVNTCLRFAVAPNSYLKPLAGLQWAGPLPFEFGHAAGL